MTKYRIVYIGVKNYMAWDEDTEGFIPAGLHLYVTTYNNYDDAAEELRKVKRMYPEWAEDIYIEYIQCAAEAVAEVMKALF